MILKGAEPVQVKTAVRVAARTTLQVTALARFEAGRTTLEEIAQV